MSVSRVGYNTAYVNTTETSVTVSITGSTANNLLIAGVCVRRGAVISTPAGWTLVKKGESSGGTANVSAALFYRIADGSESSVTISWGTAYEAAAFVAQYSGLATSGVLDTSSEDESYLDTSNSTGYFGPSTPTQQPGLAVAFAAFLVASSSPSRSYSSPFAEWFRYHQSSTYDPAVAIADHVYTTLSALSPSVTYDSSVKHYGALALFKEPSAPSPVTGSLAVTLGGVPASAAGTVTVAGAGASTLADASLGGAGTVAVAGSAASALSVATLSATGAVGSSPASGALSVTLSAVLANASGAVMVAGGAPLGIGSLGLAAAGAVAVSGAATALLDGLAVGAAGAVPIEGSASSTLASMALDAGGVVGTAPITGALAVTLGAVSVSGVAHIEIGRFVFLDGCLQLRPILDGDVSIESVLSGQLRSSEAQPCDN